MEIRESKGQSQEMGASRQRNTSCACSEHQSGSLLHMGCGLEWRMSWLPCVTVHSAA